MHVETRKPPHDGAGSDKPHTGIRTFSPFPTQVSGQPSLGMKSGGGENDPKPTRRGFLARGSSMPLLPPRREVNPSPELPVISSVFDANASQIPVPVANLGLPWMKDNSDSRTAALRKFKSFKESAWAWMIEPCNRFAHGSSRPRMTAPAEPCPRGSPSKSFFA